MTMRVRLLLLCCALTGCAAEQTHRRPLGGRGPGDAVAGHRDQGPGSGSLFASPSGEPFRGLDGERTWFEGADVNTDGALVPAEMQADAMRFFAALDRGKDGEIDPDDIHYYETVLFPEIHVAGSRAGPDGRGGSAEQGRSSRGGRGGGGMGRGGGGSNGGDRGRGSADVGDRVAASTAGRQGAGRFSYLDLPEPVSAADRNFNRGVSVSEFAAAIRTRFSQLDTNHDGKLTLAELPSIRRGGTGRRRGN